MLKLCSLFDHSYILLCVTQISDAHVRSGRVMKNLFLLGQVLIKENPIFLSFFINLIENCAGL